ncbi:hypothetical protein [Rhizobium sp. P007]|uniref:hypothetical protein n=1 Tax=Rhizobium phage RR1-A TaxID=929833 RepID=UPI0003429785|nr:hypothetical protein [Rhizobium sp. P007]YP_008130186.1 hypothetical protein RHXG_00039 [Rhizobium phage RR1-A]AGN34415.1 hypothetical protein RHXG_00039 [Rhizobium phage RR1-A]CAD7058621.1 hypothetical protein RP007_02625 [Rhizobium sp. P007]
MLTAEKSTDPNPARALYENFMTGEYGKKWDDLPAGVQKRWADALAAGVIAMTSVRIEPVADFDMDAFRSSALENGKIAVLPTQTDLVFSHGEPYAAMTVDYLGCEYLSRDVEAIEKIAAAGSKGPTEVVYLFRGAKSKNLPHKPVGYVTAARAKAMREGLAGSMTVYEDQNAYFSDPVYLSASPMLSVAVKALDAHTMQKLREAIRFSASRSVMSSADEQRILSALSAQVQDVSCRTCNDTGMEARHQICRDCDENTAEGWRLVPNEPTDAMLSSAMIVLKYADPWVQALEIYRAMLAAAPARREG